MIKYMKLSVNKINKLQPGVLSFEGPEQAMFLSKERLPGRLETGAVAAFLPLPF